MTLETARAAAALKDRVAIITGAASGIGRAQARLYAAAGARVVAVDRNAEGVAEVIAEIASEGGESLGIAADLTRPDDITRVVAGTIAKFGRIDILGNTAGRMTATSARWRPATRSGTAYSRSMSPRCSG